MSGLLSNSTRQRLLEHKTLDVEAAYDQAEALYLAQQQLHSVSPHEPIRYSHILRMPANRLPHRALFGDWCKVRGELILTNFSIEHQNGTYVLRKHPQQTDLDANQSDLPTNLSVNRPAVTKDDQAQFDSSHFGYEPVEKSSPKPHSLPYSSEPTACSVPIESREAVANASSHSMVSTSIKAWTPFLSASEQPVDATVRRQSSVLDNEEIQGTVDCTQFEVNNGDSNPSILNRLVCHLLEEHGLDVKHKTVSDMLTADLVLSGHNLTALARFARRLSRYRQQVGLSQLQLSNELAEHFNNEAMFSQSLLSR
ncbi:uncharacterized protein DEA37_0008788 [Paragonimus westermani]|uniref:Uncharacterized protein n=1 Tax=Paragonimus westermani TaxID=34504 RepID=A0A5J4N7E1_9TREM|nr:uncharacterized protein DEA37_0008788 [Paragonimus westermani]